MVVDQATRKHQLTSPLIGANDMSVSCDSHEDWQPGSPVPEHQYTHDPPISLNWRKSRRSRIEEAFYRRHEPSSPVTSLYGDSDFAPASPDASGYESDSDPGSKRQSRDFREMTGVARRYFSGFNDTGIVLQKLFPPWIAPDHRDGFDDRPGVRRIEGENSASFEYPDSHDDDDDDAHDRSPESEMARSYSHDSRYDNTLMLKLARDATHRYIPSPRKLPSSSKGASSAAANDPRIESTDVDLWWSESASPVNSEGTSDEEFDQRNIRGPLLMEDYDSQSSSSCSSFNGTTIKRTISPYADDPWHDATPTGTTIVRHPFLVQEYNSMEGNYSGMSSGSAPMQHSPITIGKGEFRQSTFQGNSNQQEELPSNLADYDEDESNEPPQTECFSRPASVTYTRTAAHRNTLFPDAAFKSPDLGGLLPKPESEHSDNRPKPRDRTLKSCIRRAPSNTVGGAKKEGVSNLHHASTAGKRIITHVDLLSLLSIDQPEKDKEDKLPRRSVQNEKRKPTCINVPVGISENKVFKDVIEDFLTQEKQYTSELTTLISGEIPAISSHKRTRHKATHSGGAFQIKSSGPNYGQTGDYSGRDRGGDFNDWIYKISKCLQKIQAIHHCIPFSLDNRDYSQAGIRALCSWATQALVHYASYLQLYRTCHSQMVLNLSKTTSSKVERLSTFIALGTLRYTGLPRNKDGNVIVQTNGGDGTRVYIANLLKGPLTRMTSLAETFNQIACLTPFREAHDIANEFNSLSCDAEKWMVEEQIKNENHAACRLDCSGVRGLKDLRPLKNKETNIIINQKRQVKARDVFWLVLEHSSGKRIECECDLLLRANCPPTLNCAQEQDCGGDLLICHADDDERRLIFPPIEITQVSAKRGSTKGRILVTVRSPLTEKEQWSETFHLHSENDEIAAEWIWMMNACSDNDNLASASTPVDTPSPTPPQHSPQESGHDSLFSKSAAASGFASCRASLYTWTTIGSWAPLSSQEVDVIVTPGLIEVHEPLLDKPAKSSDHQGTCHRTSSPLLAWELTSTSSIRRGTVLDVNIRSMPLAHSRKTIMASISPHHNVMLRSRTPDDCMKLCETIKSCRIERNESGHADTPDCPAKGPTDASLIKNGKNNIKSRRSSKIPPNPTQATGPSRKSHSSPSNMVQAALFVMRKFTRAKSKVNSGPAERKTESDRTLTIPLCAGPPVIDSCPDEAPALSSPRAADLPSLDDGLTNATVRLHKRITHEKWLSMGSARLIILPSSIKPRETSASRRKGASRKRVLLISPSGQTLMNVSLDEDCFERVSRKGIALSIRTNRSNEDGGFPKDGGVIGGGISVYMLEMKDQAETERIFGLLSRMRY